MDIGADFFLQMMKAIYPGYSEAFSEKIESGFKKPAKISLPNCPLRPRGGTSRRFFSPGWKKSKKNLQKVNLLSILRSKIKYCKASFKTEICMSDS
jgi:hypothetical protein